MGRGPESVQCLCLRTPPPPRERTRARAHTHTHRNKQTHQDFGGPRGEFPDQGDPRPATGPMTAVDRFFGLLTVGPHRYAKGLQPVRSIAPNRRGTAPRCHSARRRHGRLQKAALARRWRPGPPVPWPDDASLRPAAPQTPAPPTQPPDTRPCRGACSYKTLYTMKLAAGLRAMPVPRQARSLHAPHARAHTYAGAGGPGDRGWSGYALAGLLQGRRRIRLVCVQVLGPGQRPIANTRTGVCARLRAPIAYAPRL